jgi:hypothetical protein
LSAIQAIDLLIVIQDTSNMSAFKVSSILTLISIFWMLSSCSSAADAPISTLYPTEHLPTVISMTVAAQEIELPKNDPGTIIDQTATIAAPTAQPTQTPSQVPFTEIPTNTTASPQSLENPPPPAGIPQSPNQIISPGSGSKVISPFILRAAIKAGQNSAVRIELLGEDGRLLMREIRGYQSPQNDWISLGSEVSYGINGAAEAGRLQVSTEDEHGRLESVSSVDLILQSADNQDLHLPPDLLEDIVLESPSANRLIQDGKVRVSGLARTRSAQPLRIEIVTSDGKIVGTRQVSVTLSEGNSYGTFAIDVPYIVSSTQRVRVQVWEPGDRIPGIVNLSSVEVLLSP